MKKLFFAAVLATVAAGGAFATKGNLAPIYYAPGSNQAIDCAPGTSLCSTKVGSTTVYTQSFASGNQLPGTEIQLTNLDKARL